jgi:cysteine-rich repeat protein
MTSTSKRLPVRMRAITQVGAAAVFTLALVAGCGSSGDNGTPAGSGGASAGSAGMTSGGKNAGGAGASSGGNAGTNAAGSSAGGMMMNGEAGSAEAGEPSTTGAVCGNGKLEPGEECDDGNTKDGDGCSSICTNKCELCEAAANCSTKYDLTQPCKTPEECRDRNNEAAAFDLCYGTGTAVASGGPAAGTLKSKLCEAAIACIRKTNCAADFDPSPVSCYCGENADLVACESAPKGPCAAELAAAAEARSLATLSQAWTAEDPTTTAGAVASIIVLCDQSACPSQCFEDKSPTQCQQCAVGSNAHDFNLTCGDYTTCYFFGELSPGVTDANNVSIPPLPMAKLCAPAVDCALRTGCGALGGDVCYGNGTGPCAAEFAAAASSTDPATVLSIMHSDAQYAVNLAQSLLACEATNCAQDCFPTAAGGSGGTGGGGASAGTGGASAGTGGASAGTGGTGGASAGTGGTGG